MPPLVMLHGGGPGATASFDLPVAGGSFALALQELSRTIYLVNIRGWEKSTLPDYDFTDSSLVIGSHQEAIRDINTAVNWILERENQANVNLFGWATGGHWVSAFTIQYPQKVNRMISLNSLYGVQAPWSLRKFFGSKEDSTEYNKAGFFRRSPRENLTRAWDRSILMEDKEKWRDSMVAEAYRREATNFGLDTSILKVPAGYREESFFMSLGHKYWQAEDISVPALFIRSELDFWSRTEDLAAIEMASHQNPLLRTASIPGTHYVFLDKPERGKQQLIELMADFLLN